MCASDVLALHRAVVFQVLIFCYRVNQVCMFIAKLAAQREILWSLAVNDFRSRYLGSVFGSLWAFILPLVNLGIMWFSFEMGFRTGAVHGVPFILWLITGLFPWLFFADAVASAANSIVEKSFLVKKIVFDIELLPAIKVLSSAVVFAFLIAVMLGVFALYRHYPTLYWVQLGYYAFCLFALILSVSWLNSALVVFYRDLGQLIAVILQVGFWATPIFWSPAVLPERWRFVTFVNPVAYVVGGFRDSLIQEVWFWERPAEAAYFWLAVVILGTLGLVVFKKLRPHFADLL